MKTTGRLALLAMVPALLALGAAGSFYHRAAMRQAAGDQRQQVEECRQLIGQILWLREQPNQAGAAEMQIQDLTAAIETAADEARMDRRQLVRIWPESKRRVGDGAYLEAPTRVLIRGVNLEQISRFLITIEQNAMGLRITSLRITEPHDQDAANLWTLEATISYLIYAPITPSPPRDVSRSFNGNSLS